MKSKLNEWQGLLVESPKPFNYQIFCDMDGVLADLKQGLFNQLKTSPYASKIHQLVADGWAFTKEHPNAELEQARLEIKKILNDNIGFWATLPPMKDKDVLWNHISQFEPNILSHPWEDPDDPKGDSSASEAGKEIWIQQQLSPSPKLAFFSGEKFLWAKTGERSNILIDDYQKNIDKWEAAGGIGILHISAQNTIDQLNNI